MKCGGKTVICLLGSLALAAATRAVANEETADSANPYKVIIERNVFDLKPPYVPPPVQATNAPPPNVKLTGIATILGKKQALFLVQEPASPGKPANKEVSLILSEGQREGAIEVVEINERVSNVKIWNDGKLSELTFEKVNLPSSPVMMPPNLSGPGGPSGPAGPLHMPNYVNPGQSPTYAPPTPPGLSSIPTRTLRTTPQDAQPQPSPDEQAAMKEAGRQQTKADFSAGRIPPSIPTR
jgi:hypothetical protein